MNYLLRVNNSPCTDYNIFAYTAFNFAFHYPVSHGKTVVLCKLKYIYGHRLVRADPNASSRPPTGMTPVSRFTRGALCSRR